MTEQQQPIVSNLDPPLVKCPGCKEWLDPYRTPDVQTDLDRRLWHARCHRTYVEGPRQEEML